MLLFHAQCDVSPIDEIHLKELISAKNFVVLVILLIIACFASHCSDRFVEEKIVLCYI